GMRRFLAPAHRAALRRALPLAIEVLHARLSAEETRQLLAGVAALKGSVVLGDYISRLHCGYVCPRCGAEVEGAAYVGEAEEWPNKPLHQTGPALRLSEVCCQPSRPGW